MSSQLNTPEARSPRNRRSSSRGPSVDQFDTARGTRPGRTDSSNDSHREVHSRLAERRAVESDRPPVFKDTEQFRRVVSRERSRADRVGDQLSLIVLQKETLPSRWPSDADLDSLGQRLRCTDALGWLDDSRLGVLLPHTAENDARRVADDLTAKIFPAETAPNRLAEALDVSNVDVSVRYELFAYPKVDAAPADSATAETSEEVDTNVSSPDFVRTMPWWKRAMDIVGASIGLVLASPILLVAAILVKVTSRGPILFAQKRAGVGGRPFRMYKFRSMIADAEELKEALRKHNEASGPVFKIESDPRLTRIGRWIRRLSIDELPQLYNVLIGDMSLVGPRPPTLDEVAKYDRWQRRRLELTPGITCIWQVSGRCEIDFETWVRMDIEYAETRSFWLDVKLLLRTVPAVLGMRGAY